MYKLARSILFSLDAELAHNLTLQAWRGLHQLGLDRAVTGFSVQRPRSHFGLRFDNAIGLAAGMDKNGDYIDALSGMGFGFIEIGTVTPRPQPGNPRPRLFRLPRARAVINRMGFNNKGVDYVVRQLQQRRYEGTIGVNIGKNRDTALENAVDDYRLCMEALYPHADYLAVNISSPNTPGLRTLQTATTLAALLEQLLETRSKLQQQHQRQVPLLIKLAPDLNPEALAQTAETLLAYPVDGVIATNTTVERRGVTYLPHAQEQGGLSGAPLRDKSTRFIRELAQLLDNQRPIIAVGGIMNAADAQEKIDAGAVLVQVYTGLVYQGPALVSDIAQALG